MENATKYENVNVALAPGNERKFNFEVGESGEFGQFAKITSDGYELIVDEDFAYLKGDMPIEWREPAIAKLLMILKASEHQNRGLS